MPVLFLRVQFSEMREVFQFAGPTITVRVGSLQ